MTEGDKENIWIGKIVGVAPKGQKIKNQIILSTGMANLKEIVNTLNIIGRNKIYKFVGFFN